MKDIKHVKRMSQYNILHDLPERRYTCNIAIQIVLSLIPRQSCLHVYIPITANIWPDLSNEVIYVYTLKKLKQTYEQILLKGQQHRKIFAKLIWR